MTAPHFPHVSPRTTLRGAAVALLTGALLATGAPALAAGTHLCDGYSACYDRGMTAAGYAAVNEQSFWRMYPGHNCTNYAAYRMIRSGLPNARPWTGGGNATYWGRFMKKYTDRTPRVGAIAWWNDGGPGHVAYVEKVVSPSEIIISQDSWRGDFSWARVTKDYRWPAGFIHFNDRRLANESAPQISGTAKVGSTLAASSGSWSPSPSSVTYTWKLDGKPLGTTGSRLRLTPSMIGKRVQVSVRVERYGYPASSRSSSTTEEILPGRLDDTVAPDLDGTAQVTKVLSVSRGQWDPTPSSVSFQWLVDGAKVPGARSQRFTLLPKHAGHEVAVAVTARRSGYEAVTRTLAMPSKVRRAHMTQTRRSTVDGSRVRGQVLRVHPGAVKQSATRSVSWTRDGRPIKGATDLAYRLTKYDVGHHVAARVTWTKDGYEPVSESVGTRFVKGTVRLLTTKTRLRHGVRFAIAATVAGKALTEPARVRIGNNGRFRASGTTRDGRLVLTVTGLSRGWHKLWFYVSATDESVSKITSRRAYFR